jgi:hypothetical protein
MSADCKHLLDRHVLHAVNTEIAERFKGYLGKEGPLPANLERLMLALAQAD